MNSSNTKSSEGTKWYWGHLWRTKRGFSLGIFYLLSQYTCWPCGIHSFKSKIQHLRIHQSELIVRSICINPLFMAKQTSPTCSIHTNPSLELDNGSPMDSINKKSENFQILLSWPQSILLLGHKILLLCYANYIPINPTSTTPQII